MEYISVNHYYVPDGLYHRVSNVSWYHDLVSDIGFYYYVIYDYSCNGPYDQSVDKHRVDNQFND